MYPFMTGWFAASGKFVPPDPLYLYRQPVNAYVMLWDPACEDVDELAPSTEPPDTRVVAPAEKGEEDPFAYTESDTNMSVVSLFVPSPAATERASTTQRSVAESLTSNMSNTRTGSLAPALVAQLSGVEGIPLGRRNTESFLRTEGGVPVLGVPVKSRTLQGVDSLLSIVQMPAGVPVATFAIGEAGAVNAALFAAAIVAGGDPEVRAALARHRAEQTARVLANPDPASDAPAS